MSDKKSINQEFNPNVLLAVGFIGGLFAPYEYLSLWDMLSVIAFSTGLFMLVDIMLLTMGKMTIKITDLFIPNAVLATMLMVGHLAASLLVVLTNV
jgi:hypothetical protein